MNALITIYGYPLSYLEFFGVVFNLACVILAALNYKSNWIIGNIGVVLFGILFYKSQLYSDVILQCFFFILGLIGHRIWKPNLKITSVVDNTVWQNVAIIYILLVVPMAIGIFMLHIHELIPLFKPASFPMADSYILVWSIVATFFLIFRKKEAWILWVLNDVNAINIYYHKDLKFLAALYLVFFIIAVFGYIKWRKLERNSDAIYN